MASDPSSIVVLHGWALHGGVMEPLAAALADAGHEVACPDLPGHGGRPFEPPFSDLGELAASIGARLRYQLERDSAEYKTIYKQRTADERINSQALDLGIERPKLRRQSAITNQNTLIYVLINLRALQRVQAYKEELAHQPKMPT